MFINIVWNINKSLNWFFNNTIYIDRLFNFDNLSVFNRDFNFSDDFIWSFYISRNFDWFFNFFNFWNFDNNIIRFFNSSFNIDIFLYLYLYFLNIFSIYIFSDWYLYYSWYYFFNLSFNDNIFWNNDFLYDFIGLYFCSWWF